MTDSQKLHTAARRHCTEQHHQWWKFYLQISTDDHAHQGFALYAHHARCQLLDAIQIECEKFDFEQLPEFSELRELFVLATQVATSPGRGSHPEISGQAEEEVRNEVGHFIENFDVNCAVEPLPYRRVLWGAELDSVARRLLEHWGANKDYYFPLGDAETPYAPTLFAYNSADFETAISDEKLAEFLRARGVARVYELREWGEENYLQDVALMNPSYTGAEVFIFSSSWDWLFYASHESSVTTGGWLTQAIQNEWPDWEKAKYNPDWWR